MKKFIIYIALLSTASLSADQTGAAATSSETAVTNGNWENLTFSAIALVTAAIGILVVSINTGSSEPTH